MRSELVTIQILNENNPKFTEIAFRGELDSAGLLVIRDQIYDILDNLDKKFLVFNFAELDYINSESIGMLINVNEKLYQKNAQLVVVNAKENVTDILEVIGLSETVEVHRNMVDFLRKI